MSTPKLFHFHVAYFTDEIKNVLSGRTYHCDSIIEAIEMYIKDTETPSTSRIKYISCEENMTERELKEIRVKKT